jgi:hypothetical protein
MEQTAAAILIAFGSWAGGKLWALIKGRSSGKVATAIQTATELGRQIVLSRATMTPEQTIAALKGTFAIQLARAGIYERDRAPYQAAIDRAISALVTEWYSVTASTIAPPIVTKIAHLIAKELR